MILFLVVNLLTDRYIYVVLKKRFRSRIPARIQLFTSILLYIVIFATLLLPFKSGTNAVLLTVMWVLFTYISIYVAKYIFVIFDLLSRIPELFNRRRLKWLTIAGAAAGVLTFATFWWGALINRFHIDVRETKVAVADLPEGFDGYRIVQLSDLHVGTFGSDTTFVCKLVDKVNSLHPDLIVFTGDIVNRRSDELKPFLGPLSRLKAKDGIISILGNHDYGDYVVWSDQKAKRENLKMLIEDQRSMGWDILLNENRKIKSSGGDSLIVIGVENIGDPPFHIYGSLPKAYPTLSDNVCKILLSHNPAHWVDSIQTTDSIKIGLTLSGHTHAMQCEVFGKSPASFRYPTWGGLYADPDSTHLLYVNIGEGTVGFPARIGATPEVTLITLKTKK